MKKRFTLGDSVESSLQKELNEHKPSLKASIVQYPYLETTGMLSPTSRCVWWEKQWSFNDKSSTPIFYLLQ